MSAPDDLRAEAVDVDLSGAIVSNALCVAADERGHVYDLKATTDEMLARADADFVTTVEHIVGTYAAAALPVLAADREAVAEVGAYGDAKAEISNLHNRLARITQQSAGLRRELNEAREQLAAKGREVENLSTALRQFMSKVDEMAEQLAVERGKVAAVEAVLDAPMKFTRDRSLVQREYVLVDDMRAALEVRDA